MCMLMHGRKDLCLRTRNFLVYGTTPTGRRAARNPWNPRFRPRNGLRGRRLRAKTQGRRVWSELGAKLVNTSTQSASRGAAARSGNNGTSRSLHRDYQAFPFVSRLATLVFVAVVVVVDVDAPAVTTFSTTDCSFARLPVCTIPLNESLA